MEDSNNVPRPSLRVADTESQVTVPLSPRCPRDAAYLKTLPWFAKSRSQQAFVLLPGSLRLGSSRLLRLWVDTPLPPGPNSPFLAKGWEGADGFQPVPSQPISVFSGFYKKEDRSKYMNLKRNTLREKRS